MKTKILSILFLALILVISSCSNQITGDITLDIEDDNIKNGETTKITVSGKNTGNEVIDTKLEISHNAGSMLQVTYLGSLEEILYPGDGTTKVLNIKGYTQYTSGEYTIEAKLINKANGFVLDKDSKKIKVEA